MADDISKEKPRAVSPKYGLSKREEFAKAAMVGILSHEAGTIYAKEAQCQTIAQKAVFMADVLLAELEKQ